MNSEEYTSLVISASTIAITGGSSDQIVAYCLTEPRTVCKAA